MAGVGMDDKSRPPDSAEGDLSRVVVARARRRFNAGRQMTARDDVLTRIRTALAGQPASGEIPRSYRLVSNRLPGSEQVIALFVDRLTDADTLAQTLAAVVASDGSVVLPPGAPSQWRDACNGARIDSDPVPLTAGELDGIAAVVTGCRVAIAET